MTEVKMFNFRAASTPLIINGFAVVGSIFDTSTCPRVGYLRAHDIEPPVDDKSRGYFAAGIKHEENFIERLNQQGVKFSYQTVVKEQLTENITWGGTPDIIMESGEILELKSVNSEYSYKMKFKKGYDGAEFTHVVQIGRYLHGLQQEKGQIVYTSYFPGTEGQERWVPVKYDGKHVIGGGHKVPVEGLENGKALMVEQLQTDKLFEDLPTIYDGSGLPCDRCPLKDFCYNNYGNVDGKKLREYATSVGWGPRQK